MGRISSKVPKNEEIVKGTLDKTIGYDSGDFLQGVESVNGVEESHLTDIK